MKTQLSATESAVNSGSQVSVTVPKEGAAYWKHLIAALFAPLLVVEDIVIHSSI